MNGKTVKKYRKIAAINDPHKVHGITEQLKKADSKIDRKSKKRFKLAVAYINGQ